jgi:hypothetical protein
MADPEKSRARRVVRRMPSADRGRWSFTWNPAEFWSMLKSYFWLARPAPPEPIDTPEALARFLDSRASFVAQTSLYGYLRTRAGMRYPELFDDDPFVEGINVAKWHIWLDALSDLAVYAGSRVAQHAPRETARVGLMMSALVTDIIASHGEPSEAGAEFPAHADRVRDRVARTDWLVVGKDEAAFTASPDGLMRWAPVIDALKDMDEEIVRNSVRFRWQEVRRDFARDLNVEAILSSLAEAPPDPS